MTLNLHQQFVTSSIPGFEGFRSGLVDLPVVLDICKYNLTRDLGTSRPPPPMPGWRVYNYLLPKNGFVLIT